MPRARTQHNPVIVLIGGMVEFGYSLIDQLAPLTGDYDVVWFENPAVALRVAQLYGDLSSQEAEIRHLAARDSHDLPLIGSGLRTLLQRREVALIVDSYSALRFSGDFNSAGLLDLGAARQLTAMQNLTRSMSYAQQIANLAAELRAPLLTLVGIGGVMVRQRTTSLEQLLRFGSVAQDVFSSHLASLSYGRVLTSARLPELSERHHALAIPSPFGNHGLMSSGIESVLYSMERALLAPDCTLRPRMDATLSLISVTQLLGVLGELIPALLRGVSDPGHVHPLLQAAAPLPGRGHLWLGTPGERLSFGELCAASFGTKQLLHLRRSAVSTPHDFHLVQTHDRTGGTSRDTVLALADMQRTARRRFDHLAPFAHTHLPELT